MLNGPVTPLVKQLQSWRNGIEYEVRFWDKWMATKGLQWPDDFESRLRSDRVFDPSILRQGTALEGLKVLDVGSGPISSLGFMVVGHPIDLTACDPLAPFYSELAAKHGIAFPIKTEQAFAEDLASFYELGSFDLVHCRNALDHSFDPLRAISQMLMVAKSTGRVRLEHVVNEGENESYEGFHQWNFDVENDDFVIWNRTDRINASKFFAESAVVTAIKKENWVSVVFDKKQSFKAGDLTHQANERVKELLNAMLIINAQFETSSI